MSLQNMCSLPLSMLGIREDVQEEKLQRQLQLKTMEGNQDAVKRMVDLDLEWQTKLIQSKETPLTNALKQKNFELFEQLQRIRNLIHVPNAYGETPMHLACRLGLEDVVRRLLEEGADINAKDDEENTPVFHAVAGGKIHCVKLLIKEGCHLDTLNTELMAPMDQALLYKDHAMVAVLLRAGVETTKLQGHIYWREHRSNSFLCGLWSDSTLENMKLFLDCGYRPDCGAVSGLKKTCQQLGGGHTPVYQMLRDFSEEPRDLMGLCRQSVRGHLMDLRCRQHRPVDAVISQLPVPSQLRRYLAVEEAEEMCMV